MTGKKILNKTSYANIRAEKPGSFDPKRQKGVGIVGAGQNEQRV